MKEYLKNDHDLNTFINVFDECPIWSAPFGLKLLDYIDYKSNITALDIGFGTGFPLTEIALRLGSGSTVYGIDPWTEAIVRVREKIDRYRITNIKIIEGLAESVPLADNYLDLIVSNNGINNVNNIGQVISECSRIIRPDGQFVQTFNTDKTMFEFYEQMEEILHEMKLLHEIKLMHQHIYEKRRPLQEMIEMLRRNDFIIKDLEHDQFNYRFTDGSAMLNHYFIRLAFMDSWIKLIPANKLEEVFDTLEERLNEKAKITGGLTLSVPFVLVNAIKQ
jgi:arsenite methyltransferase